MIYSVRPGHLKRGRIKSWSTKFVFVVFRCGGNWANFDEFTLPGQFL
jgi:hypothetical protein